MKKLNQEEINAIGKTIAKFRKMKKVTQNTMADALKIPAKKLRAIENGKEEPTKAFLKKVANYIGVPMGAVGFNVLLELDSIKGKISKNKFMGAAKPIVNALLRYRIFIENTKTKK